MMVLGVGPPKLASRLRLAPLVGENCSGADDPDGETTVRSRERSDGKTLNELNNNRVRLTKV